MKRNNYYPSRQAPQIVWLANFANKLPGLGAALGLSPEQIAAAVADCLWLIYILQTWLPATRTWAQSCTDATTEAQTGTGADPQTLPLFTAPDLPNGVVAVPPGALTRIFALVTLIRDSGKCSEPNATNLGLTGSEQTGPDLTIIQAIITAVILGNQVIIKWGWGGNVAFLDSCEIHVDRNDGKGYVLLTIDTTPGYTDTQPFPTTPTRWTYRAIYRVNDAQVGVWSQPASVTVPA